MINAKDNDTDVRSAGQKASGGSSWSETWRLIWGDIAFRCEYEFKPANWKTALRMLRHPGVACVVRYRLQCYLYSIGLAPLGWLMKYINQVLFAVRIDERAKIGPGLLLGHAVSVLITENVEIGGRCALFHINTIGLAPVFGPSRTSGRVRIGNDVTFGGGACVYGPVSIGDGSIVGANAVVDQSFDANSSIFGVPARSMGTRTRS